MAYTLTYTIPQVVPADPEGPETVNTVIPTSVALSGTPDPDGGTVSTSGVNVLVSPGKVATVIYIAIIDGPNSKNVYTPAGLAVKSLAADSTIPTTFSTALDLSAKPPTIRLSDADRTNGSWDFIVLFQDGAGNFNIMDPMITNESTVSKPASAVAESMAV